MEKPQETVNTQYVGWAFRLTLILIAGIAILLLAIPAPDTSGKPKVQTFGGESNGLLGTKAPNFTQRSIDGELLSLDQLTGNPVVLNFWATWCGPCKVEHPVLQKVAQQYSSKRVAFVGVLHLDKVTAAKQFLSRYGANYPMIMDYNSNISKSYKIQGLPHTFVINANGEIVFSYPGAITNEQILQDVLDEIL